MAEDFMTHRYKASSVFLVIRGKTNYCSFSVLDQQLAHLVQ